MPQRSADTYADYIGIGASIAVQAGSVFGDAAREIFKASSVPEYVGAVDMLEALRMGRVDAVLLNHSYIRQLTDTGMYPDFDYLWVPKEVYVNETASIFYTEELRDKYNEWFRGIAADGTWEEITNRWIGVPLPAQEDIPRFELTGENGTLRLADTGNYPPLIYMDANGDPAGFDVEMASRFAQHLGMNVEFTMMAYESIIPYVLTGRADMSSATLDITAERSESVLFGDPVVITQAVLIVPGKTGSAARDYTDFFGGRIGVLTGGAFYRIVENSFNATPAYYSDMPSAVEDVRQGRIDGFIETDIVARLMIAAHNDPNLEFVEIPAEIFSEPMGAISMNQDIIDRFNAFFAVISDDGTLADIRSRWLEGLPDLDAPMPEIPHGQRDGTLVVATSARFPPFAYYGADSELKGYFIELAQRFAAHEGMGIELAEMNFGGITPYIISGRADIAITVMTITEERRQSVLFTEPIYYDRVGMIALRTGSAADSLAGHERTSFLQVLKIAIERNLITDNRWRMIVDGLRVTLIISVLSQIFGTVFGCLVCYVLTRRNKFAQRAGNLYCALIRGTPIVVILMIAYYIVFGGTDISNVFVAIAAFTMITGAGIGGNLKSAIDTVDPVEIEAARSIGFTAFGAFMALTLPQAVRRALPDYTNGFVELVKATAIVGYIAIQDLTRAGDIIRSRTYDAYFPLLLVAAIYLLITAICIQLFKLALKKANWGDSQ